MTTEDPSFLSPSAQRGKQRPGERRDQPVQGHRAGWSPGLGALPRLPGWATLPLCACVLCSEMRITRRPGQLQTSSQTLTTMTGRRPPTAPASATRRTPREAMAASVLPASRCSGAGGRLSAVEMTEGPFAYCENCTAR